MLKSGIDRVAMAAVFFMYYLNQVGILLFIFVGNDGSDVTLIIVYNNYVYILVTDQRRVDCPVHIGR